MALALVVEKLFQTPKKCQDMLFSSQEFYGLSQVYFLLKATFIADVETLFQFLQKCQDAFLQFLRRVWKHVV